MENYEKHKFLKEKLAAPRFDNEDEEIDWYAKHLYGLYHQASRLREENNHYIGRIDKYKQVKKKIKEYLEESNRDNFDFSKAKILEILEELE